MASDVDLAWAAGFFDGEGSTSILKAQRDKYAYIRMSVSQKYPELLEKFKFIVGHGKIYKSNTREIYSWNCYKQNEVNLVLDTLWPFLSEMKKQQANTAKQGVLTYNGS